MAERAAPQGLTYLIACHDARAFVGDCIDSLLAQRSDRWRAVLVDDASTDGSLDAVRPRIDDRFRLLRNDENRGYIATLKRCIDAADTDIVAILDADDALTPDATGRLLEAYDADPAAAFVFSRFAICDAALRTTGTGGRAIPPGGSALWHGHVGHIKSFRRSAYRRTAGLDDSMLYAEDRDLVYKLEEVAAPVFVNEVLYRYRFVARSQSNDPGKREIGARNAHRARRAALRRRGIRGATRLLWEILFLADYVAYSARFPDSVRAAAGRVGGRAGALLQPGAG